MEQVNWGIIGCGDVTEVKSGPAFNKVANSKLVAVMRRDTVKAKDYASRHGLPKWYSNAQALIEDDDINAIYIATPPLQHEAYTLAALAAGKDVYVEKPMSLSAAGASRMEKAATESGRKLTVAHYRRQMPMFLKVKELLEQGVIGDVKLVNLQLFQPHNSAMIAQTDVPWRLDPAVSGGGLFHDLAPHQLDLMVYYFGDVGAAHGTCLNQAGCYNADDTVTGWISFRNKVLFNGVWCFTVPAEHAIDRCEVIGSTGKLSFSVFNPRLITTSVNGRSEEYRFAPLEHVQQPMIERVVQFFLGNTTNPCPPEAGVEVMRLIDSFTPHDHP
ncbi:Gfo/Idh/MocA family oxidoreductase [Segetibacter sp. 3557_3]|uniref:Gfo/Idh/MocA family protein n=1 Tax=Segetibacter sp. 3557_3 TaxID=2547429 RepID=UPI001058B1B2|nr:Gfo/Idh/MocA family oxidoreductase [Segetibacter sp. 3557_3]TDH21574.1 Gfo/Idh/MocA family oxidoreductase [Segetibacter sp. 3557_3]